MEIALLIIGIFIIVTTYTESKSDNSILSKRSAEIISKTIVGGYILGSTSILTGLIFLVMHFYGI